MSSGVTIRAARLADAALLPAIERSAGEAFRAISDLAWIADGGVMSVEQHALFIARNGVWVAERDDGRLVGFVCTEAMPDAWHVWEFAVAHEAQGGGLGRALLSTVVDAARNANVGAVTLTTFRDVVWNAPFYTRLGFSTLDSGDLNERLRTALANEVTLGLPGERRCAMQLLL